MKALIRWGRFNLVGGMGMAVQLAALAVFNRLLGDHYLYVSAIAVDLALLHNFVWHWHYTWRDRHDNVTPFRTFVKFHLSNGLISILGNLALMRLLMKYGHLPLLPANGIAILCCSIANFFVGDHWAFARAHKADPPASRVTGTASRPCRVTVLSLFFFCSAAAHAQANSQASSSDQLPEAPPVQSTPPTTYHIGPGASYIYHVGAFCGIGASTSPARSTPTKGCGAGMTLVPIPVFVEVGVMAPQANRSYLTGYVSVDGSVPLAPTSSKYLPMAIVGYSRLFETGHAFDCGLALALPRLHGKADGSSLRIEFRDYWTFASPSQHNIMLRIGWMGIESD